MTRSTRRFPRAGPAASRAWPGTAGGITSGAARAADTSAAAMPRRHSMRAATPRRPATPSSRATSPVRTGSGTSSGTTIFSVRGSRRQPITRPSNRSPDRPARFLVTGRATSTDRDALPGHPYRAEIEAERRGWYELVEVVRWLTPRECLVPGYYRDPDWTVRDVVAHVGTWLAQGEVQFERMLAGTYEGHDIDVDAL